MRSNRTNLKWRSPTVTGRHAAAAERRAAARAQSHLWFDADYETVEGAAVQPLSSGQKFQMAALYTFDPFVYPYIGVIAAVGAGQGDHSYIERYGLAFADSTLGSFITVGVVPSVFPSGSSLFPTGQGRRVAPGRLHCFALVRRAQRRREVDVQCR